MTSAAGSETLLPVRHGLTAARIAALLGVCVPPSAAAVLIAQESGRLLPAVLLSALAAVLVLAAIATPFSNRLRLEPGLVRSGRPGDARAIRSGDVRTAVLRRIETRDELDSHRNLFLVDGSGRTVLRMSDRWWTEAQMLRVVAHLGLTIQSTEETVYLSELRRTAPEQLRWLERHGWTWVGIRFVAVGGTALLVAGLANAAI